MPRSSFYAARDLALRHAHGSNFMAEHVQKQVRFWGIAPSYAFAAEPETNGVIERFFRTPKEQAIHGRTFQTIDELRDAVRDFANRYNAEWLIGKNGYLSPLDARRRVQPCVRHTGCETAFTRILYDRYALWPLAERRG